MWETLLAKIGFDAVLAGLKARERKLSAAEYERLIGEAIAELLKLHPDIEAAEAKLRAADALGLPRSATHIRAKRSVRGMRSGARKSKKKPSLRREKKRRKGRGRKKR
jgi:hypothetical protein